MLRLMMLGRLRRENDCAATPSDDIDLAGFVLYHADRLRAARSDSLASTGSSDQAGNGAGLVFPSVANATIRRCPSILADDLCERRANRRHLGRNEFLSRLLAGDLSVHGPAFRPADRSGGNPAAGIRDGGLFASRLDIQLDTRRSAGELQFPPQHLWHSVVFAAGGAGLYPDLGLPRRAINPR